MEDAGLKEQLQHLKGITVQFGIIHDFQYLQLQMYPLMLFKASSSTAKVDMKEHLVHFTVSVKEQPSEDEITLAKTLIGEWVKSLLWDNTQVGEINFKVTKNVGRKSKNGNTSKKRKRNLPPK